MRVAAPSTPASYFHLLRKQALTDPKKPLIVFTPKSMLRNKAAVSSVEDFTSGTFELVLPDTTVDPAGVRRVLIASGKVYWDLVARRKATEATDTAIIRVEQLYPLPAEQLKKAVDSYQDVQLVWVQEEPENQGAWTFMAMNFAVEVGRTLRVVARHPPPRPRVRTRRTRSSRRICSTGPSRPDPARGPRVRPVARDAVSVEVPVPQEVPVPTVPMTPAPDPDSRIRIIALGDELLAGVGDARALGWLGRAVASEQGAESRIDVFPAALPGETSADLSERWDADVQRRLARRRVRRRTYASLGRSPTMKVDLIVRNARIDTRDAAHPKASSLAILHGRIVAIDADVDGLQARETLDLGGLPVLAGFNDVHAHSVWFGTTLIEADLSAVASHDDIYAAIERQAQQTAPGEWVVAAGYNPVLLGSTHPDPDRLDAASGGRPVWIKHASGHSGQASNRALELAGVDLRAVPEVEGGGVIRIDETGRPTGVLEERAMELVQRILLPYPLASLERALQLATSTHVEGLTSVTDAGVAGGWIGHAPAELAAYQSTRDKGLLSTRMQVTPVMDALGPIDGHDDEPSRRGFGAGMRTGWGDEWLQLGPVKVFTDGSILGRTAQMREEYEGCPGYHGYLQDDPWSGRRHRVRKCRKGSSVRSRRVRRLGWNPRRRRHARFGRCLRALAPKAIAARFGLRRSIPGQCRRCPAQPSPRPRARAGTRARVRRLAAAGLAVRAV